MVDHSPGFLKLVEGIRNRIREVSIQNVKPRLDRDEKFCLIDVREESEWAAGHLPGTIHLGKGIIERDIEEKVPDLSTEMILYCGGGFRSVLAADSLQKMGYENVVSMAGGFRAWRDAGFSIEKR